MKISVSLLNSYLYCSRKLFLEEVLMLKEPLKESVVFGTIRHEAYDMINKTEEDLVSSIEKGASLEQLKSKYAQTYHQILRKVVISNRKELEQVSVSLIDAYRKSSQYISDEAELRSGNVFNFILENNVYGDELWRRLTPKIMSELRLESDALKLKGIIDQVHIYEEEHVPIELKTGKAPQNGVWPGHRIQLAAYSLLLQEHLKRPVKEGFVYYLDIKDKRHIAINPFMKDEVLKLVDEVIALLESKDAPDFCNNKNKCAKCGLRATCYDNVAMEDLLKVKIVS